MKVVTGLIIVGLLVLSVPAAILAVLYAPPLELLRRAGIEYLLGSAIDLDVAVKGPVTISFGSEPTISIADASAVEGDNPPELKEMYVKRVSLKLSLLPLLAAQVRLHSLVIDGLEVTIDIPQGGGKDNDSADPGEMIGEFLRTDFAGDFLLRDAKFNYVNEDSGFDLRYALDEVRSRPAPDGGVNIKGTGHLNGEAWKLDGNVDPPGEDESRRTFAILLVHAGLKSALTGTYALDAGGDTVDTTLKLTAPKLKKFLAVYGISGDLGGSGDLSGRLTGRLDALKLTGLDLRLVFESGDTFHLAGDVADISAGTGFVLDLTGSLARAQLAEGEARPIYDIGVTGFSGHIEGSLDGLLARDFHVQTDSVAAKLRDFGPITAERLYKDADGHLGLYNVLVLAGDPQRPRVRVAGTVKDILQFQGVDLKGEINFLTADFLDLAAEGHAEDLGRLLGTIAISDADGSLGIELLTAAVAESSLLKLSIDLVFDDLPSEKELKFEAHLDIPRFKPFAAALGSQVEEVGAVKFDGTITGSGERIVMAGSTLVGQTTLTGSLAGALSQGKPVLSGEISTPVLHLSDLVKLSSIDAVYLENVDEQDADVFDYSKIWQSLFVDLRIKVATIAGGGTTPSSIDGRVTYLAGVIGLDPLTLIYLGGNASANGKIDTSGKETAFALKGKVNSLSIDAVLKEMEVSFPVSGALSVRYDLSGAGSAKQIPRSLNGSLTMSLRNGWIGTGLLDLTGMSLPSWLLTRVSKGNQATLVCAVAPFSFNAGRGTTQGLVLETRNVEVAGAGFIDFRQSQIGLAFKPQALQRKFVRTAQPFAITGTLQSPRVVLTGSPVASAVAGTLAFPLNLLKSIILPGAGDPGRVPCGITRGGAGANSQTARPRTRAPFGLGLLGGPRH